uniref:Uncharacterized protein n=1 Tax=Phlebotomus papatasi TaxID=29031 RepID=A0A1B0DBE1_PHLPP
MQDNCKGKCVNKFSATGNKRTGSRGVFKSDFVKVSFKIAQQKPTWRSHVSDVTEADYEDTAMEEDAASGTRRGRFRISSAGPPETTLGRFRLIPQGSNYGPTSPCLQRGRFAVIPEEPHAGSPAQGTPISDRPPSPTIEWDFDEKDKSVKYFPVKSKKRALFLAPFPYRFAHPIDHLEVHTELDIAFG